MAHSTMALRRDCGRVCARHGTKYDGTQCDDTQSDGTWNEELWRRHGRGGVRFEWHCRRWPGRDQTSGRATSVATTCRAAESPQCQPHTVPKPCEACHRGCGGCGVHTAVTARGHAHTEGQRARGGRGPEGPSLTRSNSGASRAVSPPVPAAFKVVHNQRDDMQLDQTRLHHLFGSEVCLAVPAALFNGRR